MQFDPRADATATRIGREVATQLETRVVRGLAATVRAVHAFVAAALLLGAAAGHKSDDATLSTPAQLEGALREASEASCPGHAVRVDADLTRAAQRYVRAVQVGQAQTAGAELAFYASLEAIDASPTGGVATTDRPAKAERAVGDLLPHSCRVTHAGVAAARLTDGRAVIAVLSADREIELAPLPARTSPGASVRIDGRLLQRGLSLPRLYHLTPAGTVDETPLDVAHGRFSLDVKLDGKGEHTLELLADGDGGPEVVAMRRIFVGIEPPNVPPEPPPEVIGEGLTGVAQTIAQLRAARGLPPLSRDAVLDAVAAGHSAEMARTRTFAHVLKSDGSLADRLLRARYAHRFAGENIGLSGDARLAQQAIQESPAHLMNLLDPRHTRLGLGAVAGVSPDGAQGIYLTEVLAQPVKGSLDPSREIAEQLAHERQRLKLPPLVRDQRLDALAQAHVQKLAAAAGRQIDEDVAREAIDQIGSLRRAVAELLVAGAPEDAKMSKNAGARDWAVVGIGATYASSKQYGPDRLWILLLFAR